MLGFLHLGRTLVPGREPRALASAGGCSDCYPRPVMLLCHGAAALMRSDAGVSSGHRQQSCPSAGREHKVHKDVQRRAGSCCCHQQTRLAQNPHLFSVRSRQMPLFKKMQWCKSGNWAIHRHLSCLPSPSSGNFSSSSSLVSPQAVCFCLWKEAWNIAWGVQAAVPAALPLMAWMQT